MRKLFDRKSYDNEKNTAVAGMIASGVVIFFALFASLMIFGVL